jgi:hypothetical protein
MSKIFEMAAEEWNYHKQYYEKNKARIRQQQNEHARKKYRDDPVFRENEYKRTQKWRKENPEKVKEYYKAWNERHPLRRMKIVQESRRKRRMESPWYIHY